jgi:hypothetical protein
MPLILYYSFFLNVSIIEETKGDKEILYPQNTPYKTKFSINITKYSHLNVICFSILYIFYHRQDVDFESKTLFVSVFDIIE